MGHGEECSYCFQTRDFRQGSQLSSHLRQSVGPPSRAAQLLQQFPSWQISEFPETADPHVVMFFRDAPRLCCPFVVVGYTFVNEQKPKCQLSLVTSGPDPVGVDLPFVLNNFIL